MPYQTVIAYDTGHNGPTEDFVEALFPEPEALRQAALDSPHISIIVTDKAGTIQVFNAGAEIMLGYAAAEVVGRVTPVGFSSPNDLTKRAEALSQEYATTVASGFEALVFKVSRAAKDVYEMTFVRKDGSPQLVILSVSAVCDKQGRTIGYLLTANDINAREDTSIPVNRPAGPPVPLLEHNTSERGLAKIRVDELIVKSGALQQAILNSANFSVIATDEKGIVQLFNAGAEIMLGYAAADVVDKITPADISDPQELSARAAALSKDNAAPISPNFETLVYKAARGIEDIYELTYIRKDGSRFPAVVSVTALRTDDGPIIGYLLIATDNTVRKDAEDKRLWAEESFQLMVGSVTDCAIMMLDQEGRVKSWNKGAQRIKGYDANEIIGQPITCFFVPEDIEAGEPERAVREATTTGRFEDDGWRVRKDGTRFWANVVITAIRDSDGTLRGYAKLARDMTERRRVEAELTQAKGVAEAANLAKSDFLSSMSHELRTPLNAILGFAQLMESDVPPPTANQKASVDQILQAGWYLLTLINEVLDLSLIESGKLTLSPEPVSVGEVLDDCRGMMEPLAQKRGITMAFPAFDAPCFVLADRTRLRQVFVNLLSNAIKYNRPNGSIVVDCTSHDPGHIRLSVKDTGLGLSPEKLLQLYQPFNRLGQEVGVEQGTGIGLVVTKRLIEAMHGTVGVESKIGEGTVFWIDLIATDVAQPAEPDTSTDALSQVQADDSVSARTVLYVEDNPANLKLVEMLIARRGDLRLLSACTGDLGIEIAQAHRPDVILMDINLPGTSGIKALAVLRREESTAHIPVIALSANASPRDIERGLEAGFLNYLTKPIKVDELMHTLDVALSATAATHSAVFSKA